jgi:hypothetical protein
VSARREQVFSRSRPISARTSAKSQGARQPGNEISSRQKVDFGAFAQPALFAPKCARPFSDSISQRVLIWGGSVFAGAADTVLGSEADM